MLYDSKDPTAALFTTKRGASRIANKVSERPDVTRCNIKMRYRRGAALGYIVIVHRTDLTLTAPLCNSDVERLETA